MLPSNRRRLPFSFQVLDPAVDRHIVVLEASDGAQTSGVLYLPPGRRPRTAFYLMHPRGDFTRHYAVPGLAGRGYAVLGHNSRYVNNDTDMVHEQLLLDIAAGMRYLRDAGFGRIVLLGNSGGASLLAFYQSQAELPRAERLSATPGGEPIDLTGETLPPGDLFVAAAAHPGQGRFMLNVIDPAVVDEADPLASDPAWDMYEPANGYRPYPAPSSYDGAWVATYRARQRERVARLDGIAREYIADQADARATLEVAGAGAGRLDLARRALLGRYLLVYRTLANPAYLDPRIDPNRRGIGSIFSPGDPLIGNYGPGGLARIMTPRAWLSTWSGLSSRANLPDTIRRVTIPTLVVYPDGDSDVFPSEQNEIVERSGAADLEYRVLPWADHYLHPVGDGGARLGDPRTRLVELLVPWVEARVGEP